MGAELFKDFLARYKVQIFTPTPHSIFDPVLCWPTKNEFLSCDLIYLQIQAFFFFKLSSRLSPWILKVKFEILVYTQILTLSYISM